MLLFGVFVLLEFEGWRVLQERVHRIDVQVPWAAWGLCHWATMFCKVNLLSLPTLAIMTCSELKSFLSIASNATGWKVRLQSRRCMKPAYCSSTEGCRFPWVLSPDGRADRRRLRRRRPSVTAMGTTTEHNINTTEKQVVAAGAVVVEQQQQK